MKTEFLKHTLLLSLYNLYTWTTMFALRYACVISMCLSYTPIRVLARELCGCVLVDSAPLASVDITALWNAQRWTCHLMPFSRTCVATFVFGLEMADVYQLPVSYSPCAAGVSLRIAPQMSGEYGDFPLTAPVLHVHHKAQIGLQWNGEQVCSDLWFNNSPWRKQTSKTAKRYLEIFI